MIMSRVVHCAYAVAMNSKRWERECKKGKGPDMGAAERKRMDTVLNATLSTEFFTRAAQQLESVGFAILPEMVHPTSVIESKYS